MELDNPLIRDADAGWNEAPDAGGAEPGIEDQPNDDKPCQDSTKHQTETDITVQTISFYGSGKILATPRDLSLKPGTHLPEAGKYHRISATFLSRISGHDVETVAAWARTGQCFLKLDFHLTGNILPRFTIRVIITEHQDEGISLSGGLGFALRALKYVKTLDLDRPPVSHRRRFPPPRRKVLLDCLRTGQQRPWRVPGPGSQPRPFYLRDLEHPSRLPQRQNTFGQFQSPLSPLPRSTPSLDDQDDQYSVSTDYTDDSMEMPPLTTATTASNNWLDDNPSCPGIFLSPPEDFSEANIPLFGRMDEWTPCPVKNQQPPRETFEQQKLKAEAMHAHNGDTSGMISLMALASTSPYLYNQTLFHNPTEN